ncbi:MAG: biopolymer transporter ExbD [Calditrichaeota bacterium]|nr:MAG: biopolymer transporter ExbD [Calditrichota bacterium]
MILNSEDSLINIVNRNRRNRRGMAVLQLTSMIDMFTILLVFLLKSFSAEGQIMTITRDLRLPESTSRDVPRSMSVISVTSEWILVDGRSVVNLSAITTDSPLMINGLKEELERLRLLSEQIGNLSTNLQGFRGSIAIQGDRDIPFDILKRIMFTCGQVGYNNINLAVLEKE